MRSAVIVLAVSIGVQTVPALAQPRPDNPRSITVDGMGEVTTMPDVATISYTLRGEGATSDAALRSMVASGERIEAALRAMDSAVNPRTSKVEINPARAGACKDNDYNSAEQLSKGPCAIVGYVATQDVTVDTADVKDAGTMTGLAARGGANDPSINGFRLNDPRTPKAQAIAAALADAQAKAAAIAAGSHLLLGPILNVSTVDRGVQTFAEEEIVVSGRREANMAPPPPVVVNVTPEPITTNANVTVTYAIGQ